MAKATTTKSAKSAWIRARARSARTQARKSGVAEPRPPRPRPANGSGGSSGGALPKARAKKPTHRSYRVTIPASEATLLEALADEDGLSPAAWIRQATVMRVRAVEGFQKVENSALSPAETDATSERTS